MKRAPWPLPKLLAENRNALTVYGSLRWLAGDRRQLFTTRRTIGDVCGLAEDTISTAMTALSEAGWVRVEYGRDGVRRWYRLSFPMPGFFPMPRKTRQRERRGGMKNRAKGTAPYTPKNTAYSQGE